MTPTFVTTHETPTCPTIFVGSGIPWEEHPTPETTRSSFAFLLRTFKSSAPCIRFMFLCSPARTLQIRTLIQVLVCMRNCSFSYPPVYLPWKPCAPPRCERWIFLESSTISVLQKKEKSPTWFSLTPTPQTTFATHRRFAA